MKTITSIWRSPTVWQVGVATLIVWRTAAGQTAPALAPTATAATPVTPPTPAAPRAILRIEAIEPTIAAESETNVTWLGVYAEEVSEALSSQLGLKSGEGLLITYVATDSPAAKAGLQKNDVLVRLHDQLLVHPAQLVKLIRSHQDGETVELTFFRQGKKQTASATLARRPMASALWPVAVPLNVNWKSEDAAAVPDGIHGQIKELPGDFVRLGADKQNVKLEVERSMQEARKALEEALRNKSSGGAAIGLDAKDLQALANGGVDIGENATVVVKKNGKAIRTVVQTDETGSYVLVAVPKKRLNAHDKDGKVLFDGEIETPEQQAKVPAEVWEKVKPLLDQLKLPEAGGGKPRVGFECEPQT